MTALNDAKDNAAIDHQDVEFMIGGPWVSLPSSFFALRPRIEAGGPGAYPSFRLAATCNKRIPPR